MPKQRSDIIEIRALILSPPKIHCSNSLMKYLGPILLLILSSCGGGGSSNNAMVMETELAIETILENQVFECAPIQGSSCPEGVGRVLVQSPTNTREFILCTGFLIGNQRMVTNGHCLSRNEDCSRTYVTFPKGGTSVSARCSSIERTFYDENNFPQSQDITVFTLNQDPGVRPLRLSSNGAREEETYSVWAMDHFNLLAARFTEYQCRYEGDGFTEEFTRCPMIQGNSGSPVMDNQDMAVSIIWGSTLDRRVDASLNLEERRELESLSFAYGLDILRTLNLE